MAKRIIGLLFLLVAGFLVYQLYRLVGQTSRLSGKVGKLQEETAVLLKENEEIADSIEYYKNPENLVKELKSKFDYKRPGEDLYIIVPKR